MKDGINEIRMKMKKIYYLLFAAVLAVAASCQKPQYIEPTAERQGITSLTAYFTDGPNIDKVLGKLTVKDNDLDRYVIPIPWFFPEESDNQTTLDMARVRVRAELAPNCKISPALTILDLYEEHQFVYTNAQGESKNIIITGERVKSSTATALSFNLIGENNSVVVEGFINNELMEIYLFTVEDLNGLTAKVEPWYHATVRNKKALDQPKDWNQEQEITIIAHDGKTEGTYKVMKRNPEKIDYGFNTESLKELFNIDPVSRIGTPAYNAKVYSSLAFVEGNLVIGHGPEYTPVYVDARNGSKLGEIATGGKTFGALTSDEAGNMILCNRLEGKGTFEIYRTKSVKEAPTLFYSYENEVSLPIGAKIKVSGNIDDKARITLVYEGVAGVTEAGQFLELTVVGGAVTNAEVHDIASSVTWGPAPGNNSGIVPVSAEAGVDGWYISKYNTPFHGICWLKPNLTLGTPLTGLDTNFNPTWMDSKHYNNANYLVLLAAPYFPAWGSPYIYLYDMGDPAMSGTFEATTSLIISNKLTGYNSVNEDSSLSSGDVLIAPSPDGFKVFVFYYDHYTGAIGGYSADCVKK